MLADVRQAQGPRVLDEHPEDPVAARQVADRPVGLGVDAAREEALELLTTLVENPQRRVARARQLLSDIEDALQDELEIELGYDGAAHVDESAQALIVEMCIAHNRESKCVDEHNAGRWAHATAGSLTPPRPSRPRDIRPMTRVHGVLLASVVRLVVAASAAGAHRATLVTRSPSRRSPA